MDNPKTKATENQSVEEAPQIGGMDAIRDAIKASLEPAKTPEPATENEIPTPPDQAEETTQHASDPETEGEHGHDADYSYQKRINKLTWKNKTLEEELEETRRKLYERQKEQPKSKSDTAEGISELVNQADTFEKLEQLEDEALQAERWAKRTLARYRRDPDAVEKEIQNRIGTLPEDVETWLEDLSLNAEFSRESDIPKRRKAIEEQHRSFEFAAAKYPWLKDPTNPARAWVDQVKQANPGIKNLPDVDLYLARALVGFYIEQEQAQAKTKPTKTPEPTTQPRRPAATNVAMSESLQKVKEAKANAMKTGSMDGLKDWIKAAANAR